MSPTVTIEVNIAAKAAMIWMNIVTPPVCALWALVNVNAALTEGRTIWGNYIKIWVKVKYFWSPFAARYGFSKPYLATMSVLRYDFDHMFDTAHTTPKFLSRRERKNIVTRDGVPRTTFSFYKYVQISDPDAFCDMLDAKLSKLGCLGRIYVAYEGINAQMNVPKENWEKFDSFVQSLPELSGVPYKIAAEETNTVSFYKLTIKERPKIVADGLDDDSFDVTNTGDYLTAKEMNEYIDNPDAVVVDMRNGHESEVGHFENAITPDVDTFREELRAAPELLRVHKDKKVALYCTGGIRCEKASAWLKHNGFEDVRHLKGGIIDYKRQVDEEGLDNKFLGKNFVFDERLGERIGTEIISTCHLCAKEKSDTHYHCKNQACHVLFLGCDACIRKKRGYCSYKCMTFDNLPGSVKKFLIRNNHKKKLEQFKKHRLRHAQ